MNEWLPRLLFLIPIGIVLFYCIHSGIKYTRMISHIFMGLKYDPPAEPPVFTAGDKVSILDTHGREMEALLIEVKGSQTVVLFCHDSGSTKASWERYTSFLPEFGFSVLSLDLTMRSKDSESSTLLQWPTSDEVDRVLLAIRWAKKAWDPEKKIILFGVSKGADLALAASAADPSVDAVITDGLFSMKEIFRDYIRRWAPVLVRPNLFGENYPGWVVSLFTNLGFWYSQRRSGKKFVDVESLLRKPHPPLLLIHGQEDDYIPGGHQILLQRLVKKSSAAEPIVFPKAGHNEAVVLDRKRYEGSILDFIKRNLK